MSRTFVAALAAVTLLGAMVCQAEAQLLRSRANPPQPIAPGAPTAQPAPPSALTPPTPPSAPGVAPGGPQGSADGQGQAAIAAQAETAQMAVGGQVGGQHQTQIIRSSTVIGTAIAGPDHQRIGTVREILFDPHACAHYVVLEGQAFGPQWVVVPFDLVQVGYQAADRGLFLALNVPVAQLREAPRIQANQWDVIRSPQFLAEAQRFSMSIQRSASRTEAGARLDARGRMDSAGRAGQDPNAQPNQPATRGTREPADADMPRTNAPDRQPPTSAPGATKPSDRSGDVPGPDGAAQPKQPSPGASKPSGRSGDVPSRPTPGAQPDQPSRENPPPRSPGASDGSPRPQGSSPPAPARSERSPSGAGTPATGGADRPASSGSDGASRQSRPEAAPATR